VGGRSCDECVEGGYSGCLIMQYVHGVVSEVNRDSLTRLIALESLTSGTEMPTLEL
jgi:hypothetical protein